MKNVYTLQVRDVCLFYKCNLTGCVTTDIFLLTHYCHCFKSTVQFRGSGKVSTGCSETTRFQDERLSIDLRRAPNYSETLSHRLLSYVMRRCDIGRQAPTFRRYLLLALSNLFYSEERDIRLVPIYQQRIRIFIDIVRISEG